MDPDSKKKKKKSIHLPQLLKFLSLESHFFGLGALHV